MNQLGMIEEGGILRIATLGTIRKEDEQRQVDQSAQNLDGARAADQQQQPVDTGRDHQDVDQVAQEADGIERVLDVVAEGLAARAHAFLRRRGYVTPEDVKAGCIAYKIAAHAADLVGITTVAGNVPLDLTTRNARVTAELAGRPDVEIYAGCERPMAGELFTAEYVHGETGLDGPHLPEPTAPVASAGGIGSPCSALDSSSTASTILT